MNYIRFGVSCFDGIVAGLFAVNLSALLSHKSWAAGSIIMINIFSDIFIYMKRKEIDIEDIKRYYLEEDLHPREIAKLCNCSRNRVVSIVKEQGWFKSGEERKADAKRRREQTCFKKFGVSCPIQNPNIKKKIINTNLERYGVTCTLNHPDIRKKKLETYERNYGCHPKCSHITHLENLNKEYVLDHFIKDQELDFEAFIEYFNISGIKGRRLKHEWGLEQYKNKKVGHQRELEIYNFIRSLIQEEAIFYQDRNLIHPKELDILIPSMNLAIEFDGVMYHSFGPHSLSRFNNEDEEKETKKLHLEKTLCCINKGIQLLHVFENEWINKKELWQSLIRNKLGFSNKIYARKCEIREVDSKLAKEFLEQNHLQGACNSLFRIGLFYNNELMSLMTFGKPRFNKNYQWELLRFCCKANTSVVGGASRLFKHFVKTMSPSNIISYANRRWSNGGLYEVLGFELLGATKPGYFYFHLSDRYNLMSRNKFQKYKLSKILDNFEPSLNETQNMYNHGFRKIYDCGQLVYGLTFNKVH